MSADALEQLQDRTATQVRDAMDRVVLSALKGSVSKQAQAELGQAVVRAAALADMLGRRALLQELDAKLGRRSYADDTTPLIAAVPFDQAIESLLSREPRLAEGWLEVQQVYTLEHGFSLARGMTEVLTDKVQLFLAQSMQQGASALDAERQLQFLASAHDVGFTSGYAQTVYRTNLNSAYTAGRMRQARTPAVRAVAPGFRFDAVGDADTRPNHKALDGFVALQNDPVWQTCSPPLGYNCRCTLALALRSEVEAAGLVRGGRARSRPKPAGAGPDAGFAKVNRTDAEVYPPGPDLPL